MTDIQTRYLACWNETDEAARRTVAGDLFHPDVRYVDPLVDARGIDELVAVIGGVQAQFPGAVFTAVGAAEDHHDVARFRWGLGAPGTEPAAIGADTVTLDGDRRVTLVVGFLDRTPA